jgi:hypothetical protein
MIYSKDRILAAKLDGDTGDNVTVCQRISQIDCLRFH